MTHISIPKQYLNSASAPLDEDKSATKSILWIRVLLALLAGCAFGVVAWGQGRVALLALMLPMMLVCLPNKWLIYAFAIGYQLGVLRGTIPFIGGWFGNTISGVAAWVGYGIAGALPWLIAFWRYPTTPLQKASAITFGWLLALVPFFSVVQGGHPIFGWGLALPGWGWFGIAFALVITAAFSAIPSRLQKLVLAIGFPALVITSCFHESIQMQENGAVKAVNTEFGRPPNTDRKTVDRYLDVSKKLEEAIENSAGVHNVFVLPETTLGMYDHTSEHLLDINVVEQAVRNKSTIIVGVETRSKPGELVNLALVIEPNGKMFSVKQRQPALVSMWAPWRDESFSIDWTRDTSLRLANGQHARVVICYEEFLPFIALIDEYRGGHDYVFAMSNAWSNNGGSLAFVQRQHTEGMASLFNRKVIRAENR